MSFQEQLRKARKLKGMTQQQVADLLGITNSTYCGYETGKRQPDVNKIREIAEVLGVSTDYLLELTPPATSDDDIKFALFGGRSGITDEMYEEVKQFADFIRQREEANKKPPQD